MKIKVRTLQNTEEEINVDNNDTVSDLKKKIENVFPEMACDKQKLIFSGNILIDENKVVDILKENDIVIVMVTRKIITSKKNNSTKNANELTSSDSLKNNEDKNNDKTKNTDTENKGSENISNPESILLTGDKLKEAIDNICAMGFERELVQKAMVLAYNNPNVAIDYLTNGFQDIIDEGHDISDIKDPSENPNDRDENYSNLSNLLMNYNLLDENERQDMSVNSEALRNSPFFNIIRDAALSNPQRIPEILEMIGRSDPSLLEYIRENQNEFLNALQNYDTDNNAENDLIPNYEYADEANQNTDNFNIPIASLNESEMESVRKLESLGFPKHVALEAFIACDKNEEMAANYLFENMNDYASE
ncbi:DNA repair protein RAD23, putative [Plasmodium chabaudi chabaudi]|uniref:UV excision repair protein RAD23 n=1 Tax=Plasmodium chabaudi chabaudi TaxID=31271 RepID=A0A1C6YM68_PLACU|nr:DNA repair protein RAD23, putative [Plasmodium chabaudi chabaudi]